eukprot:15361230-Ditylum_brightwellii.AAC.1
MQKALQNEINARVTHSGLQNLDVLASYVSAEDSNYAPGVFTEEEDTFADVVSLLSMDNDYSAAGSHISCFKLVIAGRIKTARDNFLSPPKKK